ncbi:MAG: hypothetical protein WBF17_04050, partial [Phycisphaerae bacterium]
MRGTRIGNVEVSRLVIGGNPFSGFSHQSHQRDREMRDYFTNERIHCVLRDAEAAGINTAFMRTDDHILGVLGDYRRAGGTIQWFAQVVYDKSDADVHRRWIRRAGELGAAGMYLHGGATDYWHANGQFDLFHEALELMRGFGSPGGFAGHRPDAHAWVRDNVKPDFQMCCHYNPTDRTVDPAHSNVDEKWDPRDRAAMLDLIATLPCPAVHYKVFAGGNRPVDEAF